MLTGASTNTRAKVAGLSIFVLALVYAGTGIYMALEARRS